MIKSKTESPTTRLKTLLLKLSEYTIDLKYQKGSEIDTSDTLSRLQNIADTPNNNRGGSRGAHLTTKIEAPAPKFYKIEAPEWQF